MTATCLDHRRRPATGGKSLRVRSRVALEPRGGRGASVDLARLRWGSLPLERERVAWEQVGPAIKRPSLHALVGYVQTYGAAGLDDDRDGWEDVASMPIVPHKDVPASS